MDKKIKIKGKQLELTNLEKVYFPSDKFTKGDLIEYYRSVKKYILPYLKDRPENMNRHPNGINGDNFYQKDVDHQGPSWLRTAPVHSESTGKIVRYLVCDDEAALVYMANLGCIEINTWHSRVGSPMHPDYCLIDLDPEAISFDHVVETAQVVHGILEKAKIKSFVKTTGKRGIHILIPLSAKYSYSQSRDLAHMIVQIANRELPAITSLKRHPAERQGKVYLDYLQNAKGQTMAAPYCVRPKAGMPVSTPLEWAEVKHTLDPSHFTVKNILHRLEAKGDLLKGALSRGINLDLAKKKLAKFG